LCGSLQVEYTKEVIMAEVKNAYQKKYQIRVPVDGRKSFVVTLPYEVVEREARKKGLTIPEFIEKFQAVASYDNFDGIHYTFEEIADESQEPK